MFFKDLQHKERFAKVIHEAGQIYSGKPDQEYGSALYVLTSSEALWDKTTPYVNRRGRIDFEAMLQEVDLSHGFSVLVRLAHNLFNSGSNVNPVDFCILDSGNFEIAIQAVKVRYRATSVFALSSEATNTFQRHLEEA